MVPRRLLGSSAAMTVLLGVAACGLPASGLVEGGTSGSGGSTGSGGTSSTATTGAAGSTGTSAQEDCLNGKDDNSDGKVDCEDPTCGAVVACDDVPAGWTVVWAKDADPMQAAGKCADGGTGTLYFKDPGGPATCAPCQCGPGSTKCGKPEITCYYYAASNLDCAGSVDFKVLSSNMMMCNTATGVPGGAHLNGACIISQDSQVLSEGCSTLGGGISALPPMWGGAVLVCNAPMPGGCMGGQTCVPQAVGPDGPTCIMSSTASACPGGWTKATPAFKEGNDTRTCSLCTCASDCSGGKCTVYDDSSCSAMYNYTITTADGCSTMPDIFDGTAASIQCLPATPKVSSCQDGQPQGQVDTMGPQMICCKP